TTGFNNTGVGRSALLFNTEGGDNVAVGIDAAQDNTTGNNNTATGSFALLSNGTGNNNTSTGFAALGGSAPTDFSTGNDKPDESFTTRIADNLPTENGASQCFVGGIWNQTGGTQFVTVNAAGKLGFFTSSRRYKDQIKPMDQASEVIYTLKPVSFRYKAEIEPSRPLSFGLIAEDVEKVSPDLVIRDADGNVNTVRYEAVNAMVLNEFLKEHKKVE